MDTAPPIPSPDYDFSVVRHLREREGQTLEQLAEVCGIPAMVISDLENNLPGTKLDVLAGIAAAFGMAASDLVALAESSRVHRRQADGYATHGFYFHRIRYPNHHSFLGEAGKNAKLSVPEVHGEDLETCWVISGRLCLTIGEEAISLGPGESLQFHAIQSHTYEALEDTIFILVHLKKAESFIKRC